MAKTSLRFLSLLILTISALALAFVTPTVHAPASTFGTLCVAGATSSTCPSAPPTFSSKLATQFTIAVNLNPLGCCQGYNAFDIRLAVDNTTVLNPLSADLTGSTLPSTSLQALCIDGQGTGCDPRLDGQGIVRVNVNASGTNIVAGAGHLFSVTYNVTGVQTGASWLFETILVTLTPPSNACNGPCPPRDLINPQGATLLTATFAVSSSPASLTISTPSSATSTLSITSTNGFAGSVALTVSLSPTLKHGPTISLSTATVTIFSGSTSTSILTVSTIGSTPIGSYTVTLTAVSGALTRTLQIPVVMDK